MSVKFLSYDGLSHFKDNLDNTYIKKTGGALTGTLTTQGILPSSNNAYNIGSTNYKYNTIHATTFAGNLDWSYIQNKPTIPTIPASLKTRIH